MGLISQNNCLFMIIDIQEKLLNAVFDRAIVSKKSEILAKTADILEIPVIITEQYPKGLGVTVPSITNVINNNIQFFEKTSFSAIQDSSIQEYLQEQNKKQVIVFGIETHICVNQTVSELIDLGYEVFVIADACGSRSAIEYNAGLDRMKEYGAHIITTEIALFELLRTAKHPHFKEIQNLIK